MGRPAISRSTLRGNRADASRAGMTAIARMAVIVDRDFVSATRYSVLLLIHRNLDDLLLDGVGAQLRLVVDIELAHQVEFVRLHRLHAQAEGDSDLLDGIALRQQLQD